MRCHLLHGPAYAVATNLADTDQKGMGDRVGHVAAHCSGSHSSGHVGEAQFAGVHPFGGELARENAVQPRTTAPGARHAPPRRALRPLTPPVHRPGAAGSPGPSLERIGRVLFVSSHRSFEQIANLQSNRTFFEVVTIETNALGTHDAEYVSPLPI